MFKPGVWRAVKCSIEHIMCANKCIVLCFRHQFGAQSDS